MKTPSTRSKFGLLAVGLALGIGAAACAEPSQDDCITGDLGCACFAGNLCLQGLTCLSGICVDLGGLETSGPGDGDGDPGTTGDGDGDGDPGTTGDGDGDPGTTGDGDGDPGMGDPCGAGPVTMLYKQGVTSPEDFGITSGIFIDVGDANIEIADEFEVPEADQCWCVTSIFAAGFYLDGMDPAALPDVTVSFYESGPGGMVPVSQPFASATSEANPGSEQGLLDVDFDEGLILSPGTRWMSVSPHVQASQTLWMWRLYDELSGVMAAARDPESVGFDGVCTVWTPAIACYNVQPHLSDITMQFEVYGVVGGDQCN